MPRMDQSPPGERLAKLLLIGDGKIGKSFFAGAAAQDGFNVLYADGDVGSQTLTQLPIEAQRRIYLMNMGDTIMGGVRDSKFIESMQEFTTNMEVVWNDDEQRPAKRTDRGVNTLWRIRPAKMDHTCVFVLDSWTGLVESIMLQVARANGIVLEEATTTQMRPVYQGAALKATSLLQVIRSMPCHVIVIAHPDEYQHKTAPEGRKIQDVKETDMVVDWTKMVPKSTSRPQSLQMPKYFTDVAWMEMNPAGTQRMMNFKVKRDRLAGGHFDDSKSAVEYSFANLVRKLGGHVPDPNDTPPIDSWLTIESPEDFVEPEPKVLDGTKGEPVKGISGLFSKGAGKP